MGLYNGAVITSAGQNLLAQAISGTDLTWTAMRASSVAIPEGTDLTTLTALTGIEQTTVITDASVYGSNVVQVSARFSNTGISEAYLMETIGIYGQVTGGSETLIAVMTAETPDEMPAYDQDSPSAFIFNVQMSVQNANSLTMVVNDTGTATVADLNRKVNLNGGDLSDTVVNTFTASIAEYPVPAAGDTMKVIGGKIVKFCADIVKTFTGASASAAGKKGLVPAPAAGRNTYYLRGDGTWQAPVNDNTTTVAGRVMDARQANSNISGTIAANVKSLNDSFSNAALLSFRGEILTQASQITLTALATLPLGTYIVQCPTAPADFPYQTAYGVLLHYGSLLNYHHIIFTTAGQGERAILYVDFSGTTANSWKKVSEDAISANASAISALQTTVSGHTTAIANNASAISANTSAINSLIAYKDLSATIAAGGVAQINSLSGYIISKDNFLQAYVIGTNTIVLRIYTYGDLLYVKPINASGTDAPAGTYTIRCVYVPRGINAAS